MQTIRIPDELHERFRDACASYKTDAGADPMTQKAFAPIVVAAGLDAIERGTGSVPEPETAHPAITEYNDALRMLAEGAAEIATLKSQLADRTNALSITSDEGTEIIASLRSDLARANEEIERLTAQLHNLAHDELARVNASVSEPRAADAPASPDDMISAALGGVTANARKGAKSRGALEAAHAIKAMIDAPTLVDAIAAAAMHYEARLDTLAAQKAKRGGSANGNASSAEEGA